MKRLRWWRRDGRLFEAIEPDGATVTEHAPALARWYNTKENASMMGGSGDMTLDDVATFYRELADGGGHGFLCFVDGLLVGDMDLRSVRASSAEFAVMIGASTTKGRGLGRTFATMIHVFAFRDLRLARIYVQPKRENIAVQRLELRLGYTLDDSPEARSHADDDDVITMSITSPVFRATNPDAWFAVELE
ncbi:MAG: GNAT family N-acetyltransferase [Labilithrix sp.]|nr:GNAT family N-acetyltransferase [Labilithrix sp.]